MKEGDEALYGCRFVHSMVDTVNKTPIHLDGAIRAYTIEKMCERVDTTLDKTARDTVYTKIWRIDNLISVSNWKELITHYYRDNMLIGEYFGGKDKLLLNGPAEEEPVPCATEELKKYIPFRLPKDDFFNFSVSFQEKRAPMNGFDVEIVPSLSMFIDNTWLGTIDYMAIPILKLIRKGGLRLNSCSAEYIGCDDDAHNFPHFLCSNYCVAQKTLNVIKEFVSSWKNDANEVISFALEYPDTDKNIRISFIGKKSNLVNYFNSKNCNNLPSCEAQLFDWCNNLYTHITVACPIVDNVDPLAIFKKGLLFYHRKMIPKEKYDKLKCDDKGMSVQLVLAKEEAKYLTTEKIGAVAVLWYKKITCDKCKSDYANCDCLVFLDKDVTYTIEQLEVLGCVWCEKQL